MFESLFRASKGQPIEYSGRRLYLADSLEVGLRTVSSSGSRARLAATGKAFR
jgi:hypothetical protein